MKTSKAQKITSILIAFIVISIVVCAFARYSQRIQEKIDQYATTTLNEFAALQKKSIYSKLTTDMDILTNISVMLESENLSFSQATDVIRHTHLKHSFYQLALFSLNGQAITADNSPIAITFEDISRGFLNNKAIYYNPTQSPANGEFILAMSYPIYDSDHEYVRYLLVGINRLEELQSYMENTFDKNGNIGVFNSKGQLIFSNQLSQLDVSLSQRYLEILFKTIDTDFTLEELYEDLFANNSGSFTYAYGENEVYFHYAPLGINDWFVSIHLNKNSFASRINLNNADAYSFFSTLVFCILILAIYAYIVNNRTKKELYNLAFFDKLTGLPNIEHFKLEGNKILEKNRNKPYFCIVFDICNFKLINDRFGHAIGDKVLCTIADTLREGLNTFPSNSVHLAKLHSDTFAILLPTNTTEACKLRMVALVNRLRSATNFIGEYKLDLSLGRYTTQPEDTAATVLERASIAHSHSKRMIPNQFVDFNKVFINNLHTRVDIINSFDDAIANGEFQIYLQPQYTATTKELHGAEVLVRWIQGDRVKHYPDVFIPILEETGRISTLDRYLREQLCINVASWIKEGLKVPHFSVNVSRVELIQPDFVQQLQNLLAKYSLPNSLIHVEITETAYTDEQDNLVKKIEELQSCGFIVEMDDFGSGYSSLNVLKAIPVDIVKLDMKLVEESTITERNSNILSSIVRMAQSINLTTIAEGVETWEQASYLESIGCDYLQGYLFAKPMPLSEFKKLLGP